MAGADKLVILIGYRGTGKSIVARLLAQRCGWQWADADEEIQRRSGMTIAEIFRSGGERAFRDLESEVVADLARMEQGVLALGGGAVLRNENRQAIVQRGKVIWLRARPETIHQRISDDPVTQAGRPDLTSRGGLAEIQALLQKRTPIYRSCADHAIDTDGKTSQQVAEEITQLEQF